ncbi:MAG: site-specific DNA-methyltransferase, partial [Thaumarchaeota archaeon]|nr:site-specific DNA-methyltransferase [Nitrososphaerota archaeon]
MSQITLDGFDLTKVSRNIPLLIIGDALQVMNQFPHESIDMIHDDAGYNDLQEHREVGTTTRLKVSEGSNNAFYEDNVDYNKTIPIYRNLLKKGRHLYIWRPSLNEKSLHNWCLLIQPEVGLLSKNSFRFRKAIVCKKSYPGMGYSFRSEQERIIVADNVETEEIFFAYKKGQMRQLQLKSLKDIFIDKWKHPRSPEKIHTSEKPLSIVTKLIKTSSYPDEIVLEPFAGSFQTGIANVKSSLNRKVI